MLHVVFAAVSWLGATLGSPASDLRAVFGDPLRIVSEHDDAQHVGRYALPKGDGYIFAIEERGYVIGIAAFASSPSAGVAAVPSDPNGVRLGQDESSVRTMHLQAHDTKDANGDPLYVGRVSATVGYSYTFDRGKVSYIQWQTFVPTGVPTLSPLTLPSGDSPSTAILDDQPNESKGVAWEYEFLRFHPCDGETLWKLQKQSLIHTQANSYDRLHVVCPTTKAERDIYFDITPYFEKL